MEPDQNNIEYLSTLIQEQGENLMSRYQFTEQAFGEAVARHELGLLTNEHYIVKKIFELVKVQSAHNQTNIVANNAHFANALNVKNGPNIENRIETDARNAENNLTIENRIETDARNAENNLTIENRIETNGDVTKTDQTNSSNTSYHTTTSHRLDETLNNNNGSDAVDNNRAHSQIETRKRTAMSLDPHLATKKMNNLSMPLDFNRLQSERKNTSLLVHGQDVFYGRRCVLCLTQVKSIDKLTEHYVKKHPLAEVFISRLTPDTANNLRAHFSQDANSNGKCAFCDKDLSRGCESHLLKHTGEKKYSCAGCNKTFDYFKNHTRCPYKKKEIQKLDFNPKAPKGFICNLCNYVQINRERIIKHLTTEHGQEGDATINLYQQINLVINSFHEAREKYECSLCQDTQFNREIDVIRHLYCKHPYNILEYKYGLGKTHIQFQCSICDIKLNNYANIIGHFNAYHYNHNMHLAVLLLKYNLTKTPNELTLERTHYMLKQLFGCKLCGECSVDKTKLLAHWNNEHQLQPIELILIAEIIDINENPPSTFDDKLFDRIFFACTHCAEVEYFSNVHQVHLHWLEKHVDKKNEKPFQFYASALAKCVHCQTISTCSELKKHFLNKHQNLDFCITKLSDGLECALCTFRGADKHEIINHFKVHDVNSLSLSPVCLTDEILEGLLTTNIHKKYQCKHCDIRLDSTNAIRHHHTQTHSCLNIDYAEVFDNETKFIIAECCGEKIVLDEIVNHLLFAHEFGFRCFKCKIPFRTTSICEVVKHDVDFHTLGIDAAFKQRQNSYRYSIMTLYYQSKFYVGNGLTLNRMSLVGTKLEQPIQLITSKIDFIMKSERNNIRLSAYRQQPIDCISLAS